MVLTSTSNLRTESGPVALDLPRPTVPETTLVDMLKRGAKYDRLNVGPSREAEPRGTEVRVRLPKQKERCHRHAPILVFDVWYMVLIGAQESLKRLYFSASTAGQRIGAASYNSFCRNSFIAATTVSGLWKNT